MSNDTGAQTLERCEMEGIDHLMDRLNRLQKLREGHAVQVDLIQMNSTLKDEVNGRSRAWLALSQNVQRRVSIL